VTIFFFTGLSGSGKPPLPRADHEIPGDGRASRDPVDGDLVRKNL